MSNQPKETPILLQAPLIRATHAYVKDTTRRPVKFPKDWDGKTVSPNTVFGGLNILKTNGKVEWVDCPYGGPGDLLYLRETCAKICHFGDAFCEGPGCPGCRWEYRADTDNAKYPGDWPASLKRHEVPDGIKWTPSIHAPKEATRTWLKITDVFAEQLHDITDAEALREGIEATKRRPKLEFLDKFWDIYPKVRPSDWVWVIRYKMTIK